MSRETITINNKSTINKNKPSKPSGPKSSASHSNNTKTKSNTKNNNTPSCSKISSNSFSINNPSSKAQSEKSLTKCLNYSTPMRHSAIMDTNRLSSPHQTFIKDRVKTEKTACLFLKVRTKIKLLKWETVFLKPETVFMKILSTVQNQNSRAWLRKGWEFFKITRS